MDIVTIISIAAGVATILGVLYLAFFGEKGIPEWLRERRELQKRDLYNNLEAGNENSDGIHPIVTHVEWDEIIQGVDEFISSNQKRYDLIVGIARGGIPIAVAISHRIESALFTTMLKRYVDITHEPFFVFDEDSNKRSIRTKNINFALPIIDRTIRRVLIVDDVSTFGNSLDTAEDLITEKLNDVKIDYYLYAADLVRLAATKPGIIDRVTCTRNIDNRREWLQFPWEVS